MLRIFLFGQPRFLMDGTPFRFVARPQVLPLLAYLLLHHSAPVTRDTLAFTLWTDETERNARANLRRHLNYLRQALPPSPVPWLLQENQTVQWNPGAPYWCDVAEFERFCTDPGTLTNAVALYSGELLEQVYADWLLGERERLRAMHENALLQLVTDARTRRDFPTAIQFALQLVRNDPLREDATRQLIALRYETGDRAGALETYLQFAERLHAELGVEPMPETLALYENITRNDAMPMEGGRPGEPVPGGNEVPPRSRARPARVALPFVGREVELETVIARWNRAATGAGGMFLFGGEAGIGKTRLAQELAHYAEAQGARVLPGGTGDPEAFSYQPVIEALRTALPLFQTTKLETQTLTVLTSLLPEIRSRFRDLPMVTPLEPARERTRLFEAITLALVALSQSRPLLVILEDVHWAGADTLALLEWIAPVLKTRRVLIVLTYREEETLRAHPLRELRRRLESAGNGEALALGRLNEHAVTRLVRLLAHTDADPRALYDASEGNPLFIEQWLRGAVEGAAAEEWLPRELAEIIVRRAARLPGPAQIMAQAAAVLGDTFSLEAVRELMGWNEHQTLDVLGVLLDHQLIGEAVAVTRDAFAFTHHLVRAAIYNRIPDADRKRRHHRAARVMEQVFASRLNELAADLARHYERGGDTEPAAQYYLRAARSSAAVYADRDALAFTGRAIELATATRLRFEIFAQAEALHARLGDRTEQGAHLETMRTLAKALQDDDAGSETLERTIRYHRALGERDAEQVAIHALEGSATSLWRARALRHRAANEILRGDYAAARENALAAQRAFAKLDDPSGQAECFCMLAEISAHQGRLDELESFVRQAQQFAAQQAGNQSLIVETLRTGSVTAFVRGDYKSAREYATQMLDLALRIGDREGQADAHWRLANAATRLFQIQDAQTHYDTAAALFERLDKRQGRAAVLVSRGSLLFRTGRFAEAAPSFGQALALFDGLNDLRGQGIALNNLAYAYYLTGDYPRTLETAQRVQKLARQMNHPSMEANGLVMESWGHRALGALDRALEALERALAVRRGLGNSDDLLTDFRDLAFTYLRAGRLEQAHEVRDEMLAAYATLTPNTTDPQTVLWAAAFVSHVLGEAESAGELLERAYQLLSEKASEIPETETRAAFLDARFHRDLRLAFEHGEWLDRS